MRNSYGLVVTPSPHLKAKDTVSRAMIDVIIALMPVVLVAIVLFRQYAVILIAVCLTTAVLTELLFRKVRKKPATIHDGSALLTGLLVALLFGPGTPWWTAALATFIGVGLAKELMGGLGWNRFNPALLGRVAVILLYPLFYLVSVSFAPLRPYFGPIDAMSQATPLAMLMQEAGFLRLGELFFAYPGGSLSETSALAVLVGGLYLIYKKHITWHIPASVIGSVFVMALLMGRNPLYHVLAGGVMIGACFMATDWVTSPMTVKGKVIFGTAIGVLLMLFRIPLAPTEGMAFSILIMNGFVPMIDRMTRRASFSDPKKQPVPKPQLPAEKQPVREVAG